MASTYTMVAYGSQGSAVRQLQSELNKRGYSLDEDGIFGKKTRSAARPSGCRSWRGGIRPRTM